METLKDKTKYDNLNYHNTPIINLRYKDVKEAVLEFENVLNNAFNLSQREFIEKYNLNNKEKNYILNKYQEIFGDFEK
jgi:hypothetical protein